MNQPKQTSQPPHTETTAVTPATPQVDTSPSLQKHPISRKEQSAGVVSLDKRKQWLAYGQAHPFVVWVLLPIVLFACYQLLWASDRYESRVQVTVQQPDEMATMDAGMAILSGLGVHAGGNDSQLVQAYIYSNDMLQYLDKTLALRQHFENSDADFFSRMHAWHSQEDYIEYFAKRVRVVIDPESQIITIYSQAFTPEFATRLAQTIAKRAEWFINDIGHKLAASQLDFIKGEHKTVAQRLQKAQTDLLAFQQQHHLLSPEIEGEALSKIVYGIEGQIVAKQAELTALVSVMSSQAPQVRALKTELAALQQQLKAEQKRLTDSSASTTQSSSAINSKTAVSAILAQFSGLKIDLELALKAFTASTVSLEKSRIEAYRQLKYLVVVEHATQAEEATYPQVIYNICLFSLALMLLYGMIRIVVATIRELG